MVNGGITLHFGTAGVITFNRNIVKEGLPLPIPINGIDKLVTPAGTPVSDIDKIPLFKVNQSIGVYPSPKMILLPFSAKGFRSKLPPRITY